MIGYRCGWIKSDKTGEKRDIVVKPTKKDFCGAAVAGASILGGITYLMWKAFKRGAEAHDRAEFDTLVDLGIIEEPGAYDGSVYVDQHKSS